MFHKRYIDPRTPKQPDTPVHHKRISSSSLLSSKPQTLRAGKASGVGVGVWACSPVRSLPKLFEPF